MPYYFTLPSGISLPADLGKVSLTTGCELHRDDSAVPNALTVANGEFNVFVASNPTFAAAEAAGITRRSTVATPASPTSIVAQVGPAITAQAGTNRLVVLIVHNDSASTGVTAASATWGASNFTKLGTSQPAAPDNFTSVLSIFYMLDATIPAGSNSVTITQSAANSLIRAHLVEYTGVNQTTPLGTDVRAAAFNTSLGVTVNMTTTTGLLLSAGSARMADGGTFTASPGSEIYPILGTGIEGTAYDDLVGATGNRTHTYASSTATSMELIGVEVLAV